MPFDCGDTHRAGILSAYLNLSLNPNGIAPQSPWLRRQSLPWVPDQNSQSLFSIRFGRAKPNGEKRWYFLCPLTQDCGLRPGPGLFSGRPSRTGKGEESDFAPLWFRRCQAVEPPAGSVKTCLSEKRGGAPHSMTHSAFLSCDRSLPFPALLLNLGRWHLVLKNMNLRPVQRPSRVSHEASPSCSCQ